MSCTHIPSQLSQFYCFISKQNLSRSATVSFTRRDSRFLSSNIHPVTPKHLTMVYSTDSNNFLTALFVDIIQTTINLKPSLVCLFVCKTVCHMCSAAAIFNAAVRLQTAVQHCRLIVWDFICFHIYTFNTLFETDGLGIDPGGVTGDFFRGKPERTRCSEVDSA